MPTFHHPERITEEVTTNPTKRRSELGKYFAELDAPEVPDALANDIFIYGPLEDKEKKEGYLDNKLALGYGEKEVHEHAKKRFDAFIENLSSQTPIDRLRMVSDVLGAYYEKYAANYDAGQEDAGIQDFSRSSNELIKTLWNELDESTLTVLDKTIETNDATLLDEAEHHLENYYLDSVKNLRSKPGGFRHSSFLDKITLNRDLIQQAKTEPHTLSLEFQNRALHGNNVEQNTWRHKAFEALAYGAPVPLSPQQSRENEEIERKERPIRIKDRIVHFADTIKYIESELTALNDNLMSKDSEIQAKSESETNLENRIKKTERRQKLGEKAILRIIKIGDKPDVSAIDSLNDELTIIKDEIISLKAEKQTIQDQIDIKKTDKESTADSLHDFLNISLANSRRRDFIKGLELAKEVTGLAELETRIDNVRETRFTSLSQIETEMPGITDKSKEIIDFIQRGHNSSESNQKLFKALKDTMFSIAETANDEAGLTQSQLYSVMKELIVNHENYGIMMSDSQVKQESDRLHDVIFKSLSARSHFSLRDMNPDDPSSLIDKGDAIALESVARSLSGEGRAPSYGNIIKYKNGIKELDDLAKMILAGRLI